MKKILYFLSENFQFLVVKFSVYLNKRVFVMRRPIWVLLGLTCQKIHFPMSWFICMCSLRTEKSTWRCVIIELVHEECNKVDVHSAKTQISLGIRPVWSESSLFAQRVDKDPHFLHVNSEDSDQIGRMPRLIWVFAGRTCISLVLSRAGSIMNLNSLISPVVYKCYY